MFGLKNFILQKKVIFAFLFLLISICVFAKDNYFAWLLCAFTTYNVMANNCAQTIGIFIASNKNKSKTIIFYFLVIIFILTILISWLFFDRQLHFSLLNKINYNENLNILLIFLPILLFVLTRYKIPLSATFLIIPVFTNKHTIETMITKTSVSYFLSFILSLFLWKTIYTKYKHLIATQDDDINNLWNILQYISTGIVWSVWIIVSCCNFVVFLPRVFELRDLILFIIIVAVSIFVVLTNGGGKIQEMIEEKSYINIKSSVLFNIIFSGIMLTVQFISKIPITSTWVFLGILAGRELAITVCDKGLLVALKYKACFIKIWSDLCLGILGITFSLCFVKILDFFINYIG